MNCQGFLENFRYVAEAPNGVEQLRELVYYLAVTGALCPQDSTDGDGPALLREIEQEREARIEQCRFKRSPRLEALTAKYDENRPAIPASWIWTRLVDIGEISPRNLYDDELVGSFASMSAISAMHGIEIQGEDRPWHAMKKGFTHFADNDVVVAKITPCFENGKAAIATGLTNGFGAGTTELHVVRPLPGVEPKFIYLFLRSPYFRTNGIKHMTGTAGQKRLPSQYFATRPFPLPPTIEQRRIVAKADELMTLCDRLETLREERQKAFAILSKATQAQFAQSPSSRTLERVFDSASQASSVDLKDTIFTLAVQGMLEPSGAPRFEVKIELEKLKRKKAERSELGEMRSRKPVVATNKSDWPYPIPETWELPCFDDVALIVSGVTKGRSLAGKEILMSPYLRVANVQRGRLDLTNVKQIAATADDREKYQLQDGDVLMTEGGDWDKLGRAAIWNSELPDCIYQNHIYRVRSADTGTLLPEWIMLFANSRIGRSYFEGAAKQTTNLASINMTQLRKCPLPFPSYAEQCQIVAKVKQLATLAEQLAKRQRDTDDVAEAFAKAVVTAITGTVSQDTKPMKLPKNELVTCLQLVRRNSNPGEAEPLATLLAVHGGALSANALWQHSALAIDAFYQQLKTEMAAGWLSEPEPAVVREVESD